MTTDNRRHPAEFLDEAREIRARWAESEKPQIDVADADQMRAANDEARQLMGQHSEQVIDVEATSERQLALFLACAAAADRHGPPRPARDPSHGPKPELIDIRTGIADRCDVCDTRARLREEMDAQYGPHIYRARICVRCRRFAPDDVDAGADAA